MYWVMNIHDGWGIHLHQYVMPTGDPTSHGCVRLLDPGTMVLVFGEEPTGDPRSFRYSSFRSKQRYPILRRTELPRRPCAVPPGSPQQTRRSC